MKTTLMRGVPASLQMDAWWISGDVPIDPERPKPTHRGTDATRHNMHGIGMLLALVLLADWLFWGHTVGLSLVAFAVAVAGCVWTAAKHEASTREVLVGTAILIIGLLPVLIFVQLISVMFYMATVFIFAAWVALNGQGRAGDILRAGGRLLVLAPMHVVRAVAAGSSGVLRGQNWCDATLRLLRAWALPVMVGGVFIVLLVVGNPVFEHLALQLPYINADFDRLAFWLMIAAVVWPLLGVRKLRQRMMLPFALSLGSRIAGPQLLNAQSVTNSLVLFNVMFAAQTGLDMIYLWGGAPLPAGMTLATYAHRGAYPLVATALLAGGFALISRPYVQERPMLRWLLLLWLAQNLALVAGAVARLESYVEVYGLTYLRVAAFIWMGLVAAGLVLIGWQVVQAKRNSWMLARMSGLLVLVLYLCSFVNFANVIAQNNLTRANTAIEFALMDRVYICDLGPMALPAIAEFEHRTGLAVCPRNSPVYKLETGNWREWGFRKWQVQRYLAINSNPWGVR